MAPARRAEDKKEKEIQTELGSRRRLKFHLYYFALDEFGVSQRAQIVWLRLSAGEGR
ncbi:hypothetical protein CCACVL1_13973 [Corchorus capsularis]|uniref:Uncharacterized protein n=1 Tax=Corchorus capsularis TaxID=210143 RepID=A0A1R3I8X6_COCAP|nr:hypothetical protein CCACVL1_13973 [Corchorus capsularis]